MKFFHQTLTSLAVATIATISAFDAPASAFTLTQNGSNPQFTTAEAQAAKANWLSFLSELEVKG